MLFAEICERERQRLAGLGIEIQLHRPSEPTPKAGIRLDATSAVGLAQLVLWDTGELDLVVADSRTGAIILNEHRDVSSELGIFDAIDTIEAHLGNRSGP